MCRACAEVGRAFNGVKSKAEIEVYTAPIVLYITFAGSVYKLDFVQTRHPFPSFISYHSYDIPIFD